MGPGTRVLTRLLQNSRPTSYVDALALRHDIEYLSSGEKWKSDLRAALQAPTSLQGVVMRLGLLSRVAIDAVTHMLPGIPKFHLNSSQGLPEPVLAEVKRIAKPMLEEWDVVDEYY